MGSGDIGCWKGGSRIDCESDLLDSCVVMIVIVGFDESS